MPQWYGYDSDGIAVPLTSAEQYEALSYIKEAEAREEAEAIETARKWREERESKYNDPVRVALRTLIHKLDKEYELELYQDFQD